MNEHDAEKNGEDPGGHPMELEPGGGGLKARGSLREQKAGNRAPEDEDERGDSEGSGSSGHGLLVRPGLSRPIQPVIL